MKRLQILILVILGLLSGCTNNTGVPNDASRLSSTGYILFVAESGGKYNLYLVQMDGLTPISSILPVYSGNGNSGQTGAIRYPHISNDGVYAGFVQTKGHGHQNFDNDEDIYHVMDMTSATHIDTYTNFYRQNGEKCKSIKYPAFIDYAHPIITGPNSTTPPEVLFIFTCTDDWVNREAIIATTTPPILYRQFLSTHNNNPPGASWGVPGHVNGMDNLVPTEFALHPNYSTDDGGIIFSAHKNSIRLSEFIHNQPGDDFVGSASVYINTAQHRVGGHCKSGKNIPSPNGQPIPCGIPFPTILRDGYAPSISADGQYLMYNAEAFNNQAGRGEELFVIDLPTSGILDAFTPSNPGLGTPFTRVWTQLIQHLAENRYSMFRKFRADFSNRVANRLISFILQKKRSTILRMA